MNTILLVLCMLFVSSQVFTQSSYFETVTDNSDGDATILEVLPWDQNQLVQVIHANGPGPSFTSIYGFEKITNGVSTVMDIPSCTDISTEPVFLSDGILVTGTTSLLGVECVFYDGTNVIDFDFNTGSGDSYPVISLIEDRVFIIAFDGNHQQLYEFDKVNHTVNNITNEMVDVYAISAVWGDDIYYSTRSIIPNGDIEHLLRKASLNLGVFTYSTVRSIIIISGDIISVSWKSPVVKWGKLYIVEGEYDYFNFSDSRIISIDQNDQVAVLHESLQVIQSIEDRLFEWDGALWTYGILKSELFKCTDGLAFSLDVNAGNKQLNQHHISENDKLYFNNYTQSSDDYELVLHNGSFQTILAGAHFHFLLEENGILYLSNHVWGDMSSIVILHTADDGIEEIVIAAGEHSPVKDAAIIFENAFNFLFTYDLNDTDVLKLSGSPFADVNELSIDFTIYPNPIISGHTFSIETNTEGIAEILSSNGTSINQIELHPGTNIIETSSMSSGVYFISFMNHAYRVVVN